MSKNAGLLEKRFEAELGELGLIYQSPSPQYYGMPLARSAKGLYAQDFGLKPHDDQRRNPSGVNLSLPQAQQSCVPVILNSHTMIAAHDAAGAPLDRIVLTSADLARKTQPAENTCLNNVVLRTDRIVSHYDIIIGNKRVSTIRWPRMNRDNEVAAKQATSHYLPYSVALAGVLGLIMIDPADVKIEIHVHFSGHATQPEAPAAEELPLSPPAESAPEKPCASQMMLLLTHQIMLFQGNDVRRAFLRKGGCKELEDAFTKKEKEPLKKDDQEAFVNTLPRGYGFKATTHEPIDYKRTGRTLTWKVPARQNGRRLAVVWLRAPPAVAERIEQLSFLGSDVHASMARSELPKDTPRSDDHVNFFFHFSPGSILLNDAGSNAIVTVATDDEFVCTFDSEVALDASIEAYAAWYDLYAVRDDITIHKGAGKPDCLVAAKSA